MSRRASFFARQHPGLRRVRFPDEIVFEETIKEADGEAIMVMLRRASLHIDVNRINMAGMTALHQVMGGKRSLGNWVGTEFYKKKLLTALSHLIAQEGV